MILVVLRCTSKLLKRLKLDKEPLKDPGPSTTALGDWYANVIYIKRQPLVLAVSERSLLPLLMPARDLDQLPDHLTRTLIEKLLRMEIPEATIEQEVAKMDPLLYGKTASRSVLGSMNDFTDNVKYTLRIREQWSLQDWMDWLSDMPCKPIQYKYPSEVARALLKEHSLHLLN
jgi:hypothetical protein